MARDKLNKVTWELGFSLKATVAEFIAMAAFVYIGTGTATTFGSYQTSSGFDIGQHFQDSGDVGANVGHLVKNLSISASWGIITALAFGLAITVLAYATAHLSGGQLNPAVTFGLALVGALSPLQAAANIIAQIVGAILGSAFLYATIPNSSESPLGSNRIAPGVGYGNALCGEIVMTWVLVAVVLETAVSKKSLARAQAPMAIGFAVFTAHAVLLPIDGCSINPARSLGPAIVSGTWPGTFWVFIVGPFLGALAAVPFHLFFRSDFDTVHPAEKTTDPVSLSPAPSVSPQDSAGGGGHLGTTSPKVTVDREHSMV